MSDAEQYSTDEVARAWLIKMRGSDAAALRPSFETWLAASPDHRAAYDRIARALDAATILKGSRRHGTARADALPPAPRRRWVPITAAAMTAMVLMVVSMNMSSFPFGSGKSPIAAQAAEPLVTGHGEIRTFHLPGGATATLDTDSQVDILSQEGTAILRLVRGRARFDLGKSAQAFRIEGGTAILSGRGAVLDVSLQPRNRISVTLLAGNASIRSDMALGTGTAIDVGHPQTFSATGGKLVRASLPATKSEKDWPNGWAEHRSIRLDRLIAEANRYAEVPIVIDDPAIAGLEASGRFKISEPETVADRLAMLFELKVERRRDAIHLRPR